MKKIGIYAENRLPPNIEKLLLNLGKMLHDHFKLDVIGKFTPPKEIMDYYDHYSYYGKQNTEGFQRIRQAYQNCQKYVIQNQPDLLLQLTKFSIYGLPISFIGTDHDIPTILRISGDTFNEYKIKKYDLEERFKILIMNNCLSKVSLKLADRVIVLTEYQKKEAIRKGCIENKIRVIPQPIDTTRFSSVTEEEKIKLRFQLNLPKNKKLALIVGRMTKTKGLDVISETLKSLKDENIHFVLIGKGDYGAYLGKKYPADVSYIGYVPFQEIHRYYKACDILVHPSKLEGLPNTVLEGMASGLPVIIRKADYASELEIPDFSSHEDLLDLLYKEPKKELPELYRWDNLKSKYIGLFEELLD